MKHENLFHNAVRNHLFSLQPERDFQYPVKITQNFKEWVNKLLNSRETILYILNLPLRYINISSNNHLHQYAGFGSTVLDVWG